MTKHRVTLKDIASQLGITVTTVSKALKDYPDISKETKQAVKKLADELHYIPNPQALVLRGHRSYTIGLIIPEIVHYFFSNVIKGVMNVLENHGYSVLITLSNNSIIQEKKQAELLFANNVDGVLVSLANETIDTAHFNVFKEYEIPIVMFDKVSTTFNCNKVIIDDEHGGYTATKHLIDQGCTRIAHIRGPEEPLNATGRFNGYVRALKTHGLAFDHSLIRTCKEVTLEEGSTFGRELLRMDTPPDGIFAVTDQVGVGVIKAANTLGKSIPEQVRIIGFSDSQIAQISMPALSTIHQPGYEIGETAADLLIKEISVRDNEAAPSTSFSQVILDTYLIKRASS